MSEEKLPYPKSVFFIVVNEFCERFSYYGMKAILAIYLKNVLDYTPDKATVYYHAFSGLCYFTPLFGAMIADSLLGKFRTILYLSIVYAIGNVTLSTAATPLLDKGGTEALSLLGLLLIAIGTGGIKPCVSAFGGDQFKLPQQAVQLSSFFSIFYFSINAGSLLSTAITPALRKDIPCFGQLTCYSLAFAVPAALMIVALVVFIIGKPWYTMRPVEGNIVSKVISCVTHAIVRRSEPKRDHWLDKADDKYDRQLIDDIKVLFKILVLFIPLPVFWALFDQQGSRWTFQATRMDGEVFGFQIKPDQIQIVNPVLILALIPLFDQLVYPIFNKIGIIRTPLQKMTAGGVLAAAAFGMSALLELKLESTYEVVLGAKESHLNFINTLPCTANISLNSDSYEINTLDYKLFQKLEAGDYKVYITGNGKGCSGFNSYNGTFTAKAKEAQTYTIVANDGKISIKKDATVDELMKSKEGDPKLKLIITDLDEYVSKNASIVLRKPGSEENVRVLDMKMNVSKIFETEPHIYELYVHYPGSNASKPISGTIAPRLGGNYIISLTLKPGTQDIESSLYTVTEPNSVHMVWLLPQYFVITVAEILFSISGLEFSYSQAPASMKSVVSAAWLLTVAFGNIIVIIIAESVKFSSQAYEFLLFAGLMIGDMVIFAVMAYFYKPTEVSEEEKPSDMQMKQTGTSNTAYDDDN